MSTPLENEKAHRILPPVGLHSTFKIVTVRPKNALENGAIFCHHGCTNFFVVRGSRTLAGERTPLVLFSFVKFIYDSTTCASKIARPP